MNTKKLTEAAMLSSLFVVASLFFIGTGLGYSIFLEIGVPILITLICLRCDIKYTIMSSVTSLIIVMFVFGNLAAAIMMIQGMLIGFICGAIINKNTPLNDDFLYCSLLATIVLIFVDIFFAGILGTSLVSEAKEYLVYIPYDENIKEVIFYIIIAALPLGTIIMTYIGSILLGKKLRFLNKYGQRKFFFIRNYKKYGNLQYCSKKATYIGVAYVVLINLIGKDNIIFRSTYIRLVLISFECIILYFLIKDAYSILCGTVYKVSKSRGALLLVQLLTLYSLVNYFKFTAVIIITASIIIDNGLLIRKNSDEFIKRMILR